MRKMKYEKILQMAEKKGFSILIHENGDFRGFQEKDNKIIKLDSLCDYIVNNDIIIINNIKIEKLFYNIYYDKQTSYIVININNIELWGFYTDINEIETETSEGLFWMAQTMAETTRLLYLDNDSRIENTLLNNSIIKTIEYSRAEKKRLENAIFRALKQMQKEGA